MEGPKVDRAAFVKSGYMLGSLAHPALLMVKLKN
jgi:hypothetical protein